MVSSISSDSNADYLQQLMAQMMANMNATNADSKTGVSKSELSSIDTGDDKGGSGFLKALSANFDKIDTNGDGQLSKDEIGALIPPKQPMGPPPGMSIENMLSSNDTDGTAGLSKDELSSIDTGSDTKEANFVKNLTDNFDKIDTNKDGQLSTDEIKASRPKGGGHHHKEESADSSSTTTSTDTNTSESTSSTESTLSKLSDYFVKQLLNAYQKNASSLGSNLASSLNVAI